MRILTALLLMASAGFTVPAKAQMSLPQTRMVEAQREVTNLNRSMEAAKAAIKEEHDEAHAKHVRYTWMILAVIGLWLYHRRRRPVATQPKSGL